MVALYTVWYNWCRMHKSLGETPAMVTGLAIEPFSVEWPARLSN